MRKHLHIYFSVVILLGAFFSYQPSIAQIVKRSQPFDGTGQNHSFDVEQTLTATNSLSRFQRYSGCGIRYIAASTKLSNRQAPYISITGNISITGADGPNGVEVVAAYLYWVIEGNNAGSSIKLNTPQGVRNVDGELIGRFSGGKCWPCNNTFHYRADVTAAVCKHNPNGEYQVRDYPNAHTPCPLPPICLGNMNRPISASCNTGDTDGAMLVIVFRDFSANYNGTFLLDDGIIVKTGGAAASHEMTDLNVCAVPTNSTGFIAVSDFQASANPPHQVVLNGVQENVSPKFFNLEQRNVILSAGQTFSTFGAGNPGGGDCYSILATGLYFQTPNCPTATCTPRADLPVGTNGRLTNQEVCNINDTITLNLIAQRGNILRWEVVNNCFTGIWTPIAQTSPILTIGNPLRATDSYCVRAVVNSDPCTEYSNIATIRVRGSIRPGAVTGGQAICAGNPAPTLRLTDYEGDIVRWELSTADNCLTAANLSWLPIPNISDRFTPVNLGVSTCYRAVVSQGACGAQFSTPARITVSSVARGGVISGTTAICQGNGTVNLELTQFDGTIVKWESSTHCQTDLVWEPIPIPEPRFTSSSLTQTTCFRAVVQGNGCPASFSNVFRVQVSPQTRGGRVRADTTICGTTNSGTLRLVDYAGSILRWESSSDNFQNIATYGNQEDFFTFININSTTRFRAVLKSGDCPEQFSQPAQVTIVPLGNSGTLTSAQTICDGQTPRPLELTGFSGTIERWETSFDGITWTPIAGANSGTLTPGSLSRTTYYRALVRNAQCASQASNNVIVTVIGNGNVGSITGANVVCEGNPPPVLTLSGASGQIIFWESSVDNGQTWTTIDNTFPSFRPNSLLSNTLFRVALRNPPCELVKTPSFLVQVVSAARGGSISGPARICAGSGNAVLSLSGQGGVIGQWESSIDQSTWVPIGNNGNNTLTVSGLRQTTFYRVALQTTGCPSAFSSIARVEVEQQTVAGTLTGGKESCFLEVRQNLQLTGFTGTVRFWEQSVNNGQDWTSIAHTGSTYFVDSVKATTQFRAVVANGNCPPARSNAVSITLTSPSIGGTLTGSTTICRGGTSGNMRLSGFTGNIVDWQASKDFGVTWSSIGKSRLSTIRSGPLTVDTWFRAMVQNAPCPAAPSGIAKISVGKFTSGGILTGSSLSCGNDNNLSLTVVDYGGTVRQWESSIDNGATWTTIAHTLDTYRPTSLTQTTRFRVAILNGVCGAAFSNEWSIILAEPSVGGTLTGGSTTVCANSSPGMLTLGGYKGRILRWEASFDRGMTWKSVAPGVENFTPPGLSRSTFYRVLVQNGDCPVAVSAVARVTVVNALSGGSVSGPSVFCTGGGAISLNLIGLSGGVQRWESSTDNWASFGIIANTTTNLVINDLRTPTSYRALVSSGRCAPVYSQPWNVGIGRAPIVDATGTVGCNNRGNIQANARGGAGAPYRYSIDPAVQPDNTTGTFTNLALARYTIRATDEAGCTAQTQLTLSGTTVPPEITAIVATGPTSGFVTWTAVAGLGVSYRVLYRIVGSSVRQRLGPFVGLSASLSPLQHSATYEVIVEADCGSGFLLSEPGFIETPPAGSCNSSPIGIPGGLYTNAISATTAIVNWSPIGGLSPTTGYILSFGPITLDPLAWTQLNICHPTTTYRLTGLIPSITYGYRLRTNCSNCTTALQILDRRSDWSAVQQFTTLRLKEESGQTKDFDFNDRQDWMVYPNPLTGQHVSLIAPSDFEGVIDLQLYQSNGAIMMEHRLDWTRGILQETIEVPSNLSGIYRLVCISGDKRWSIPLMIHSQK
jgi:hypothetical protein